MLGHTDIEKCEPVLERLQGKAAEDETDAECAEAALGEMVRIIFDERIDGYSDAGNNSSDQAYAQSERPRMVEMMDERTAEQGGEDIAEGADDRSPELAFGKARPEGSGVVDGRAHAAPISEYLASGNG